MNAVGSTMRRILDVAFWKSARTRLSDAVVQSAIAKRKRFYENLTGFDLNQNLQLEAYRVGLHAMQELLYRSGGSVQQMIYDASALPACAQPNLDLIAAVEVLAGLNLAVAEANLPQELRDAARTWDTTCVDRQIEVCKQVYHFLLDFNAKQTHSDPTVDSTEDEFWLKDYRNQPLSRIFAGAFLGKSRIEPNCFGKGQLLVSFCREAGAKCYGVTPISIAEDFVHPVLSRLGGSISRWAEDRAIALPAKLKKSLERRAKAEESIKSVPDRFHMAVAVKLADGRLYLVDPHMRVCGLLNNQLELEVVLQLIDFFCPVLPGYCALESEGGSAMSAMYEASMAAGSVIEMSNEINQRWSKVGFDGRAAIPLLAQSKALELLVQEGVGISKDEQELHLQFLRGEKFAIFELRQKGSGQGRVMSIRSISGQEIPSQMRMRLQVATVVLGALAEDDLFDAPQERQGEICKRGLEICLGILQAIAYKHSAKALGQTKDGLGLIHPILELYEPEFRIGVELLAHINAITAHSNEVIMSLAAICGGQHHLSLAATEPLRTRDAGVSELAGSAAQLLRGLPALLPSAREGLSALEAAGMSVVPGRGDAADV